MRIAIVAAAAVLAAGCFGGLKKEVEQPLLYRIDAPKLAAGAALAADLKVVVSSLAPGLDEPGIATRWPGQRLDYLAGARWAEELSALLESALVESFQDSGRLRSVQGDLGRFRATHTLVDRGAALRGGLQRRRPAGRAGRVVGDAGSRFGPARAHVLHGIAASEGAAENRQSSVVAALECGVQSGRGGSCRQVASTRSPPTQRTSRAAASLSLPRTSPRNWARRRPARAGARGSPRPTSARRTGGPGRSGSRGCAGSRAAASTRCPRPRP